MSELLANYICIVIYLSPHETNVKKRDSIHKINSAEKANDIRPHRRMAPIDKYVPRRLLTTFNRFKCFHKICFIFPSSDIIKKICKKLSCRIRAVHGLLTKYAYLPISFLLLFFLPLLLHLRHGWQYKVLLLMEKNEWKTYTLGNNIFKLTQTNEFEWRKSTCLKFHGNCVHGQRVASVKESENKNEMKTDPKQKELWKQNSWIFS